MCKVFLLCSGLGNVNRGYESFTIECFNTIVTYPQLDLLLYKGGGTSANREIVVGNLPRFSAAANLISRFVRRDAYAVEQYTFALNLIPHLLKKRPDVIYFSDGQLGNFLYHFRKLTGMKYKLLFSNGAPHTPPFRRWDHVQQLAPIHYNDAIRAGQSIESQTLLPYGISMSSTLPLTSNAERQRKRHELGIPPDSTVLLSVGAINRSHKRMDYVVRELAALPTPRPYLMVLGQTGHETPEIEALAIELLGKDNFQMKSVPHGEVKRYYQIADIFALASLREGLARVTLEAQSFGLQCLLHDYDLNRFVLGDNAIFKDFTQTGGLTTAICEAIAQDNGIEARRTRHASCFERFSWQRLGEHYVNMVLKCANNETP